MRTYFLRHLFIISLFASFCVGNTALAADPKLPIRDTDYAAKFVSQSVADPITIEAGKTKTVIVTFKNVGTATWNNSSGRFLSAYTVEPKYRTSVFRSDDWLSGNQTARMDGVVKPGQTGKIALKLTAPQVSGTYVEQFYLSAEDYSWVKGGYFFLKVTVAPSKVLPSVSVAPIQAPQDRATTSTSYKANVFMQTVKSVTVKGGERVEMQVAYQNVGKKTWPGYTVLANSPSGLASVSSLSFADESWAGPGIVLTRTGAIDPDAIARETIAFRAPEKNGVYTAAFHLTIDGEQVENSEVDVAVTVTDNAPDYVVSDVPLPPPAPEATRVSDEPSIRVGIWKPDSFVQFRSEDDDYNVYDGETLVGILPKLQLAVLKYDAGTYSFTGAGLDFQSQNYIHLTPVGNPHAIFTLWNMERKIKWKGGSRNFNQYRGAMEYRLTQNGTMYVINDVLFEDYVAGIGEASNIAPMEFLKAQAVASRSYAYFIANHTDKHDSRNFDVVATTGDQLYLGYVCETITQNFVAAVAATRGMMATYEHNIVITPYFGHSNGKTKSWVQVWGGVARPWLVSVKAIYDKGLRQYGHGVGMSQRDAALRAQKDGWDWERIVKYYYTGVEVEKIYN